MRKEVLCGLVPAISTGDRGRGLGRGKVGQMAERAQVASVIKRHLIQQALPDGTCHPPPWHLSPSAIMLCNHQFVHLCPQLLEQCTE